MWHPVIWAAVAKLLPFISKRNQTYSNASFPWREGKSLEISAWSWPHSLQKGIWICLVALHFFVCICINISESASCCIRALAQAEICSSLGTHAYIYLDTLSYVNVTASLSPTSVRWATRIISYSIYNIGAYTSGCLGTAVYIWRYPHIKNSENRFGASRVYSIRPTWFTCAHVCLSSCKHL